MKGMSKTLKNEKGITLIALVITIVILIILAGIAINLVVGQDGIIQKAKLSKQQHLIGQYKENIELAKAELRVNNDTEYSLENLCSLLASKTDWVADAHVDGDKIYLITTDGYEFNITLEATEFIGINGEAVPTPEPTSAPAVITISADPENNSTPATSLDIDIEVTSTKNITNALGYYAWKLNTPSTVADGEWEEITLTSSGATTRTGMIPASRPDNGNYYLWIKTVVDGQTETEYFGPYVFQPKPTAENLVGYVSDVKTENNSQGTVVAGRDEHVFAGWTLCYDLIRNGSYIYTNEPITPGPTTNIPVIQGDIVYVKYSKTGESDVTIQVNVTQLVIAYRIHYDLNGGTGTIADSVAYGSNSVSVTASEPVYDGKAFAGWNTQANGQGTSYAANAAVAVTEANHVKTLYAQWDDLTASNVEFEPNDANWLVNNVGDALDYLYNELGNSVSN